MIRTIAISKLRQLCISSCSRRGALVKKNLQCRLFSNGTSISSDDDRQAFLKTMLSNDDVRNSMVYSLTMSPLEGSKFPPLTRRLNDREREQLRISKIQRRQFRSNSAPSVAAGENKSEQRRSNSNAQQREQDRESLLRALGEDQRLHNSMAYSLAMAMELDDLDEKEQLHASTDTMEIDRTVATEQIYGQSPMTDDDLDLDIDDYDYDDNTLSMNSSLSFDSSSNLGLTEFPSMTRSLNDREINQLRNSKAQLVSKCTYPEQRRRQHPLPRTLRDALLPSSEAIVITENKMPFRVLEVNEAWEGLCGYSNAESKGESLGALLGGKETDMCAVTALIHQLFVHGEDATTVLTNYTKSGRKFRNRLSVGPLYNEETNEVSHFVGILKEVSVAA